ncbi:hypothetical protein [Candidatus Uabimicrobium sp. HlEnr_7]|uniref:hypothetical protein n=1 Tax=Candidatus Uabimicrobium helgolandensis TaxID=3095367 RepID=UPI003558BCA1
MKSDFEERLIAMLAIEHGLMSEKNYTKCLNIRDFFRQNNSLLDILIEEEILTPNQIKNIRSKIDKNYNFLPPSSINTIKFGEIAQEMGMISQKSLEEALISQQEFLTRGIQVPIGQILYSKGLITFVQIYQIISKQNITTFYCKKCDTTLTTSEKYTNIPSCQKCGGDLEKCHQNKKVEKALTTGRDDSEPGLGNLIPS